MVVRWGQSANCQPLQTGQVAHPACIPSKSRIRPLKRAFVMCNTHSARLRNLLTNTMCVAEASRMASTLQTTCCIVGGGPAGIMLAYLLARKGVRVTVLEKHKDFFRDFRGDTVHPSTLEVMYELGILDELLTVPHQELRFISGVVGGYRFKVADFTRVPTHCKFVALMPQWDFLNFLTENARHFPEFELRMQHEATGLLRDKGRITGVVVQTPDGPKEIAADLVVACDGRHSTIREAAGLPMTEF